MINITKNVYGESTNKLTTPKLIFQCEIKQRRTRQRTTQRRTKTTRSRKNTKEKLDVCENHLFRLKERGKKMQRRDSRSKIDLKSPLLDE
ncbi:hypothetical protein MTR_5g090845 [Medicago truncatula]|uniref:Uncharacterized protein n=1 Tax=Medicago truncatula TaxID=3880 RepID=A0A072UFF0_MEDTR|nr:hypothetical protein MTR_5g090845 [Medicago truncatula]